MKDQYYLTEYLLKQNIQIRKGYINLFNAPAGSGKTSFMFSDEGIIYNTTKFIDHSYLPYVKEKIPKNYNFSSNLDKILYICDTTMLKDKILNKYSDITKDFDNKSFKEAKNNDILSKVTEDLGRIKVLTYAQFGKIMSKDYLRKAIYKYFDLVIMDEFHNLFDYANKFDTEDNITYGNIINNINALATSSLLVCLTATPYYANRRIEEIGGFSKNIYNVVLSQKDIDKLIQYETKITSKEVYLINMIKWLCINEEPLKVIQAGCKILIYTTQIKTCNKYKDMLTASGYRVESLWTERKMNEEQKELKQYLINIEKYPDDLDVLIINKAYDTGWDLKDESVQFVLVDSSNLTIQTQVRNRCRHEIQQLVLKAYDEIEFYHDRNGNQCSTEYSESPMKFTLDDKYLNVKLSKEIKKYLVNRYAIIRNDGNCSWKTFKGDLEHNGYITKTTHNGTYIYNKDNINIINNKIVEVKKMNNEVIFINWIEKEWDKKRISIQDVKDILDIGTTSFNKLIKSESIVNYFKENRYNIGTVKGGKVKYLKKY